MHGICENQSVDGQAEKSLVKKMHNINFYNLCMCTRSLVGNLSLWSIIQTLVDFSNKIQNGYVEQGMKHKSFENYNLFKNIITFYKFSVTEM